MKTQMHVKTGKEVMDEKDGISKKKAKTSTDGRYNFLICAALIAVLAASGYAGAGSQEEVRMTAAPVISRSSVEDEYEGMTFDEVESKLREERKREIAVLDGVITGTDTDEETRENAQNQKLALAKRMETEAQVRAALEHMGLECAAALCTEERTVLIVPAQYAEDQETTVRIIDAAAAISGCTAKDVKIILVKK